MRFFRNKRKTEASTVSKAVPTAVHVNPIVRLDVDRIKTLEDVKVLLRAMEIMFPENEIENDPVRMLCNSEYVNPRIEKIYAIAYYLQLSMEYLAGCSDDQIDDTYNSIVEGLRNGVIMDPNGRA